ncbi:uncharacterized protein LOC132357845 [Balaenoptera ricei]|uniref:uncharacterized protein LOC132357845 n=1 Tax=Balaenoptera ricei TaxID=2746895 RepID=UPI0028BEBA86|nr:uncharacterized protein LOC132357845 [Balaenoptera ricei]
MNAKRFFRRSSVHAGWGPAGTSEDHVCQRTSRPQLECSVLTAQRWEPVRLLLKRLRAEVNGRQSKRLGQGQILTTSFTRSEDLRPPRVRPEGPAPCSGNLDLGPASTSFTRSEDLRPPRVRNLSPVVTAACLDGKRLWDKVPRLAGQRYKGSPCRDDHLLRSAGRVISKYHTLCHPSFWPLYEAASGRGLRASLAGHQSGEQPPRDAGFPVMCCEDVFLSDPLLPCGQCVPLYLSQAPQQVMGSLKLLVPPPGMSPWVLPTPSSGCSTAWLRGPEPIALTGLLQMSQGEPGPSSPGAPMPPAGPPDPASDHPGAGGGQSCSHWVDPSPPRAPDNQGP